MEVGKILTVPLFPLETVLFPGGALPLRIFEPRYLDMISHCMKTECGIGVVLIEKGAEVGGAAKTCDTGTLSNIIYWHKRTDGMLGITLKGEQRFRICGATTQPNQLIIAEVELLPHIEKPETSHSEEVMVKLLKQIISQLEPPFTTMETYYDDVEWVTSRLIELLPIPLQKKQEMLCLENITERLQLLKPLLVSMDII
jgi:Lon protease-like protein